ncbi:MAG: dihydroneopterin aldolase [Firmicutes bacterium]|nr:dihydroneopterin aldolase [Bacillota bacterium]
MDKIIMKNLAFYGYHGVLQEENLLGQKFFLDIELLTDLKEAGKTDEVEKTVSYADVYSLVKDIVKNHKYNLLEALGENIAKEILEKFQRVVEITIKIKKPEAPVNGIYDYFGIEIRRNRNE